jgi:hypothetical protein
MLLEESIGQLVYFNVLCGGLVALLWVMFVRSQLCRFRFTLRALFVLMLMESLVFWVIELTRTRIPF